MKDRESYQPQNRTALERQILRADKKRRKKEGAAIFKRPLSNYARFVRSHKDLFRQKRPLSEVSREVAQLWKNMDTEAKNKFNEGSAEVDAAELPLKIPE